MKLILIKNIVRKYDSYFTMGLIYNARENEKRKIIPTGVLVQCKLPHKDKILRSK